MSQPRHIRLMKCSQAVIVVMSGQIAKKDEGDAAANKDCREQTNVDHDNIKNNYNLRWK